MDGGPYWLALCLEVLPLFLFLSFSLSLTLSLSLSPSGCAFFYASTAIGVGYVLDNVSDIVCSFSFV